MSRNSDEFMQILFESLFSRVFFFCCLFCFDHSLQPLHLCAVVQMCTFCLRAHHTYARLCLKTKALKKTLSNASQPHGACVHCLRFPFFPCTHGFNMRVNCALNLNPITRNTVHYISNNINSRTRSMRNALPMREWIQICCVRTIVHMRASRYNAMLMIHTYTGVNACEQRIRHACESEMLLWKMEKGAATDRVNVDRG